MERYADKGLPMEFILVITLLQLNPVCTPEDKCHVEQTYVGHTIRSFPDKQVCEQLATTLNTEPRPYPEFEAYCVPLYR